MTAPTVPAVDIDARTIEELQPPCEVSWLMPCPFHGVHRERCDKPARWIVSMRCPGGDKDHALICDGHIDELKRHLDSRCAAANAINR